jgi:hypothetical protein
MNILFKYVSLAACIFFMAFMQIGYALSQKISLINSSKGGHNEVHCYIERGFKKVDGTSTKTVTLTKANESKVLDVNVPGLPGGATVTKLNAGLVVCKIRNYDSKPPREATFSAAINFSNYNVWIGTLIQ